MFQGSILLLLLGWIGFASCTLTRLPLRVSSQGAYVANVMPGRHEVSAWVAIDTFSSDLWFNTISAPGRYAPYKHTESRSWKSQNMRMTNWTFPAVDFRREVCILPEGFPCSRVELTPKHYHVDNKTHGDGTHTNLQMLPFVDADLGFEHVVTFCHEQATEQGKADCVYPSGNSSFIGIGAAIVNSREFYFAPWDGVLGLGLRAMVHADDFSLTSIIAYRLELPNIVSIYLERNMDAMEEEYMPFKRIDIIMADKDAVLDRIRNEVGRGIYSTLGTKNDPISKISGTTESITIRDSEENVDHGTALEDMEDIAPLPRTERKGMGEGVGIHGTSESEFFPDPEDDRSSVFLGRIDPSVLRDPKRLPLKIPMLPYLDVLPINGSTPSPDVNESYAFRSFHDFWRFSIHQIRVVGALQFEALPPLSDNASRDTTAPTALDHEVVYYPVSPLLYTECRDERIDLKGCLIEGTLDKLQITKEHGVDNDDKEARDTAHGDWGSDFDPDSDFDTSYPHSHRYGDETSPVNVPHFRDTPDPIPEALMSIPIPHGDLYPPTPSGNYSLCHERLSISRSLMASYCQGVVSSTSPYISFEYSQYFHIVSAINHTMHDHCFYVHAADMVKMEKGLKKFRNTGSQADLRAHLTAAYEDRGNHSNYTNQYIICPSALLSLPHARSMGSTSRKSSDVQVHFLPDIELITSVYSPLDKTESSAYTHTTHSDDNPYNSNSTSNDKDHGKYDYDSFVPHVQYNRTHQHAVLPILPIDYCLPTHQVVSSILSRIVFPYLKSYQWTTWCILYIKPTPTGTESPNPVYKQSPFASNFHILPPNSDNPEDSDCVHWRTIDYGEKPTNRKFCQKDKPTPVVLGRPFLYRYLTAMDASKERVCHDADDDGVACDPSNGRIIEYPYTTPYPIHPTPMTLDLYVFDLQEVGSSLHPWIPAPPVPPGPSPDPTPTPGSISSWRIIHYTGVGIVISGLIILTSWLAVKLRARSRTPSPVDDPNSATITAIANTANATDIAAYGVLLDEDVHTRRKTKGAGKWEWPRILNGGGWVELQRSLLNARGRDDDDHRYKDTSKNDVGTRQNTWEKDSNNKRNINELHGTSHRLQLLRQEEQTIAHTADTVTEITSDGGDGGNYRDSPTSLHVKRDHATVPPARGTVHPTLSSMSAQTETSNAIGAPPVVPNSFASPNTAHDPRYISSSVWSNRPRSTPQPLTFSYRYPVSTPITRAHSNPQLNTGTMLNSLSNHSGHPEQYHHNHHNHYNPRTHNTTGYPPSDPFLHTPQLPQAQNEYGTLFVQRRDSGHTFTTSVANPFISGTFHAEDQLLMPSTKFLEQIRPVTPINTPKEQLDQDMTLLHGGGSTKSDVLNAPAPHCTSSATSSSSLSSVSSTILYPQPMGPMAGMSSPYIPISRPLPVPMSTLLWSPPQTHAQAPAPHQTPIHTNRHADPYSAYDCVNASSTCGVPIRKPDPVPFATNAPHIPHSTNTTTTNVPHESMSTAKAVSVGTTTGNLRGIVLPGDTAPGTQVDVDSKPETARVEHEHTVRVENNDETSVASATASRNTTPYVEAEMSKCVHPSREGTMMPPPLRRQMTLTGNDFDRLKIAGTIEPVNLYTSDHDTTDDNTN